MPRAHRVVASVAVGAVLMGVSGCQGAFDLPLPGGAANRGDIFRVTAEFADVLDLVPQSQLSTSPTSPAPSTTTADQTGTVRMRGADPTLGGLLGGTR
jgi:hypothetical protein